MRASKGLRAHIGIYGRRNVGKSSLLNAITGQSVSIVSPHAGTTTDPVEKPMELLPLGPVLFIDTAGIDDDGALGELRIEKTKRCVNRTDCGIIVAVGNEWGCFEDDLITMFRDRDVPCIVAFNKIDVVTPDAKLLERLDGERIPVIHMSATKNHGVFELKQALIEHVPEDYVNHIPLIGDLVAPNDLIVLVVPIDKEAPKGRLILPQVQVMRDLLDNDALCVVTKERDLGAVFERFKRPPALVVTDSQAFSTVAADTPPEVPMTGFSILFARFKGDLTSQVVDTMAIDSLTDGDDVLIAESCTHHPIADDIGRVKIPRWLMQYTGLDLKFTTHSGHDFPDDLSRYKLVIHCGSCMHNRRAMLNRILFCRRQGVPITNYGLAIAYTQGIFERALQPFPAALEAFKAAKKKKNS